MGRTVYRAGTSCLIAMRISMSVDKIGDEWKVAKRPANLTRSFEFESYDDMRDFLDDLADLSEAENYYPNINFTRNQVNMTIQSEGVELGQSEISFAEKTNDLFTQQD